MPTISSIPIIFPVVGYQTSSITGYQMATPTFKNITTENYPIDNFTVQGATDAKTTIQVLDADGQVQGMYYWYNEFTDTTTGVTYPAGWTDVSGLEPANISLKPGEAVFFYTEENGVTIQSAGEVPGEITRDIQGYVMVGNGSPVNLEIDNLTVTGATDAKTTIQLLDADGQVSAMYYWYNEFTDPTTGVTYPAGWTDVSGLEPAGITLAPGEAALFYSEESGVKATIPSAL